MKKARNYTLTDLLNGLKNIGYALKEMVVGGEVADAELPEPLRIDPLKSLEDFQRQSNDSSSKAQARNKSSRETSKSSKSNQYITPNPSQSSRTRRKKSPENEREEL